MQPLLQVIDLISDDDSKRFAPAGRMAAAIIEITLNEGGCLPQDLNAQGFTPDEVARNWYMAKTLATVELKLLSDKANGTKIANRRKS